jgi:type IV secretory pathway TraG/TraD family ATPase VirD4
MSSTSTSQTNRSSPSLTSLIMVPIIVGLATAAFTMKLLWHDAPEIFLPLPDSRYSDHFIHWIYGLLAMLTGGLVGAGPWHSYATWVNQLDPTSLKWALYARFALASISGCGSAVLTFLLIYGTSQNDTPLRGRPLRQGRRAIAMLAAESAREWKGKPPGIRLHPQVMMSQERETKHLLIMGASGSGKTHIVWHVLNEAIRRKDRVVIFDSKGDFTSELKSICLLAPWDPRSRAWDVAIDCPGPLDAQSLAARMIPDSSKDPIWPNASRAVLVAMIIHLQSTKPGTWNFADLREMLHLPIEDLRLIAQQHNPEAQRSLEEGSKTTQSILINLTAFMAPVVDMARAWGSADQKRFSMRRWIEGDSTLPRTVVMQGSQRFEQTAASLVNSLLSVMAATIASPSLPDDPQRRIWLILDEFAQLGQLRDIGPLIRMGRSKGLRIVIGAQDIAESRAIYGIHQTDAWTSSLTTSIYTRLEGGGTAEWVSRRIGDQETEETNESKTQASSGSSETQQTAIRKSPTVLPSQLKSLVGTRSDGVDALIDGFDDAIYLVRYPYHKPQPIRSGSRYATWVEPVLAGPDQPTAQAVVSTEDDPITPATSNEDVYEQGLKHGPGLPTAQAAGSTQRAKRWARRLPPASGETGATP